MARMLRTGLRSFAVGSCILGAAALIPACADNETSLYIVGVLATETTECVARPDPGGARRARGWLDLEFRTGYYAALLVGNQLTATGSRDKVRTESDRIALRGAEVRVEVPGRVQFPPYTAISTGFADPAAGETPGFASMLVQLLPADLSAVEIPAAGIEFVSHVRVFGETIGGTEVTSNELAFPIIVCRGCLVAYPVTAADPTEAAKGNYRCRNAAAEGAVEEEESVCVIGQDVTFPCTLCSATEAMCRDPAQNPAVATP